MKYHPIAIDEIIYHFDTLQDNSIKNIVIETGYNRNKVRAVLSNYKNKFE